MPCPKHATGRPAAHAKRRTWPKTCSGATAARPRRLDAPERLARTLDRDELVASAGGAGGVTGRDCAGDVRAIELAKRGCLREFARLAIGGCDRLAARGAAGEAAVDAVPIGIVGDYENALLGLSRNVAVEHCREGESG